MSKIFFTVAFYHDGPSRRPQFGISTLNGYGVQMTGLDLNSVKFGNGNLGDGFRHRFEYLVGGGPSVTRISLVMNTTAILPHIAWSSSHPIGAPTGTGPRGSPPKSKDKDYPPRCASKRTHVSSHSRSPGASDRSHSSYNSRYNDHVCSQRDIDPPPYSGTYSPRPKRINPSYARKQDPYVRLNSDRHQAICGDDNHDWQGDRGRYDSPNSSDKRERTLSHPHQSRDRYDEEYWED